MHNHRPQAVFLAAARVGGIHANNTRPAISCYDNLMIEANFIEAESVGVEKLLFLGSSCIYPKHAEQPIREEALLTGPLSRPTNGTRLPRSPGSSWPGLPPPARLRLHQRHADQPLRSG
jgi:GDP-L-fucose synthase